MAEKQTEKQVEITYTKEQIVNANRYTETRDIVSAVLEDGKSYTLKQVDDAISKYKKGKVI